MLVVLLLGIATVSRAQEATLAGTITDSTGAVLPGVTVTATHLASGNVFNAVSEGNGDYRFAALRVGVYRITAELSGFATATKEPVELLVGQRASLNMRMEVSSLSETLTVSSQAPLVDTTQSKLGGNIDPRQMEALPVNGRNWLDLTLLAPGARGNSVANGEAPVPRDNGAYELNLDGQQVTSIISNTSFGNPRFSRDAIAEFQVLSNRFDATQGRSTGMQINAVTKSGTNIFGGSAFGYFRSDKFNAADFIVNRVLPYSDQQAGGTFGGPIRKDRVHFFAYYEGEREAQSFTFNSPFPSFNIAPLTGSRKENKYGTRFDAQLSSNKRFTLRGNKYTNHYPYDPRVTGGAAQHPSTASTTDRWSDQLFASFSHVLSDRAVNEIKGGYTSFVFESDGIVPSVRINLIGYSIGKPSNYPQHFGQATWSLRDDFSSVYSMAGRHEIKAGGEYLNNLIYAKWPNSASGVLTVNAGPIPANIQSLFPVWDNPSTWNIAALSPITTRYTQAFGNFALYMPEDQFAFWYQDDWSVSTNLTLNLGLRYDVSFGALREDLELLPWMPKKDSDIDNIAPRLGFAYKIGDKTVIRGGAGKFFAYISNNQAHSTTLSVQSALLTVTNDGRADFASNPFNGRTPTVEEARALPQDINFIDPQAQTPYAYQGSIGFQRQIGSDMAFEADYVFNGTRFDWEVRNVNLTFNPVTGTNFPFTDISKRPVPNFGVASDYETNGHSNYNGLQTALTKRFSKHWQGTVTYTLSRMYDDSTPYSSTPDNSCPTANACSGLTHYPFDMSAEYGPSTADQRHRAVFNGIWSLPYDVQVSGLYFFGSGEHFSNVWGGDLRNTGNKSSGRLKPDGTSVPRDAFVGSPVHRVDVRATKRISLGGSVRLEGSFEMFNVFNHANFGSYALTQSLANYGQPQQNIALAYQPRMMQLGVRMTF
jgi:hypothetical protein